MAEGYLFLNQNGDVQVGPQQQDDIKERMKDNIYAISRKEVLDRDARLQTSKWRGRDSGSMTAIKTSHTNLIRLMQEVIPADEKLFNAKCEEIRNVYHDLVDACESYINSHKNPRTSTGKQRKAMVVSILSDVRMEREAVRGHAEEIRTNLQEGMIWGNLFGAMKEDVKMSGGVYSHFDEEFSEEKTFVPGERSMELGRVASAAMTMESTYAKGKLVGDMAEVWVKNNLSPELKKEYHDYRKYIAGELIRQYNRTVNGYVSNFNFVKDDKDKKIDMALAKKQYAYLWLMKSDNYELFKGLQKLAEAFGETKTIGIEGEEILNHIPESEDDLNLIEEEKREDTKKKNAIYRRMNARKILEGYIKPEILDRELGGLVKKGGTEVQPIKTKRPEPKEAGKEKLTGKFDSKDLRDYMSSGRKKKLGEKACQQEDGNTLEEKWASKRARYEQRFGGVFNSTISNASGTVKLSGLNTSRLFTNLSGVVGGDLDFFQFEDLFNKLCARYNVGEGAEHISVEEADRFTNEGIDMLIHIYLDVFRKMEATYGKLISQMHPEDVFRQFGTEYFDYIKIIQDTEQLMPYILNVADQNRSDIREFMIFNDYFNDLYNQMHMYEQYQTMLSAQVTTEDNLDNTEYARDLNNAERYRTIGGPAMTVSQQKQYNKNLKKRFHDRNKEEISNNKKLLKQQAQYRKKHGRNADIPEELNTRAENWDFRIYGPFKEAN